MPLHMSILMWMHVYTHVMSTHTSMHRGELFHNLVASESARPRQPPMRMLRDQLLHDKGIREDKGFVSELNWQAILVIITAYPVLGPTRYAA